jgi:hypothetical protein
LDAAERWSKLPPPKGIVNPSALRPWGVLAICLFFGCGSSSPGREAPAFAGLPPYTAIDAQLFDHALTPEAFGIISAATDDKLEMRARAAEGILPMRITTVSRDTDGEDTNSYELTAVPVAPALKGPPPEGPLVLSVDSWSPSYGMLQTLESRLAGTAVLVFYRRYREGASVALHWHAEADTERVRAAVENAKLVAEVSQ